MSSLRVFILEKGICQKKIDWIGIMWGERLKSLIAHHQTSEQYEAEYRNASRVTAIKHNITNHPYSRCLWFSFIRCQFVSLEAFCWLPHILWSYLRNSKKVVRLLAMVQGIKRTSSSLGVTATEWASYVQALARGGNIQGLPKKMTKVNGFHGH